MKKQTVIEYFGSINKTAAVLEIAHTSVIGWDDDVIPEGMAARLEKLTDGKLKYDHEFYMAYKKARKQAA
jgi:transcriptional repressor of cell division inhibition gene dicB